MGGRLGVLGTPQVIAYLQQGVGESVLIDLWGQHRDRRRGWLGVVAPMGAW